ncbi:MAG: hypothetical protein KatS3mg114_0796 [Planctomycetaceae bacterium]|nr:MAG: hypothetical protein KatS3mg114_0796 [Planctomycetaceae bacterium]
MSIRKGMLWSLATVLLAASANAVSKPVDDFVVSVRVVDKGEKEKLHVDQTVKVSNDGQLNLFSGGEFAGSDDAPALEFGTRITGKLGDFEGETKSLTLKVEFSSRFDSGESKVPVVRGEMVAFRTAIKPGETTRVAFGKNRWCELRLERQGK